MGRRRKRFLDVRVDFLVTHPAGNTFQACSQDWGRNFWQIDLPMKKGGLTVELRQYQLEVGAHSGEVTAKVIQNGFCENLTAISCHED